MRIGELAERVGVNPRTIRYYESIDLLPEPDRNEAGYRIFDEDDIDRLEFIRRATELNLQLDDIREILVLREQGERPCDYVLHVAHERLDELDARIAEMQRARDELEALIERARDLPDNGARYCPLIEHQLAMNSMSRADSE